MITEQRRRKINKKKEYKTGKNKQQSNTKGLEE